MTPQDHKPTRRDDPTARSSVVADLDRLRAFLRALYYGRTRAALRFQYLLLVVDLAIIAFFIVAPIWRDRPIFIWLDVAVATIVFTDVAARALASTNLLRWLRQLTTVVDLFILLTLLLPGILANLGFLRVLRLWTLSRSGFLWHPLRRTGLEGWEETARASINILVFIFLVTGFVYTFFVGRTGIDGYVDALYFTVTSMTTTGYGDITLEGTFGKLTSIAVMIVGITLFVRLAQALFRPNKVRFPCPQCGLQLHDPDAVHCKACGHVLNIPDEGH
jgi:voltage-gated potassium channel